MNGGKGKPKLHKQVYTKWQMTLWRASNKWRPVDEGEGLRARLREIVRVTHVHSKANNTTLYRKIKVGH